MFMYLYYGYMIYKAYEYGILAEKVYSTITIVNTTTRKLYGWFVPKNKDQSRSN